MGLFNGLGQVVTEHLERRTKQNELFYPIKEKRKKKRKVSTINKEKKKMKTTFALCACLCIQKANPEKLGFGDKVVNCYVNNVSKFNFVFKTIAFIITIKNYITSLIESAFY